MLENSVYAKDVPVGSVCSGNCGLFLKRGSEWLFRNIYGEIVAVNPHPNSMFIIQGGMNEDTFFNSAVYS